MADFTKIVERDACRALMAKIIGEAAMQGVTVDSLELAVRMVMHTETLESSKPAEWSFRFDA